MRRAKDMDAKDRQILALLEEDSRRPNSEIARLTGLSAPTVAERIGRLSDIGVIRRFTVDVDPERIGLPIAAMVKFQPNSARGNDAVEAALRHRAVRTCHRVTGSSLLELTVRVGSGDQLKAFLEVLRRHGETETSLILTTDFENRPYFEGGGDSFNPKE